jgi:DNA-directed RNA polymerase subunit alpha
LLERESLNFGMKYEETPDGVRITDQGTPPNRNVATVGADDEEEV